MKETPTELILAIVWYSSFYKRYVNKVQDSLTLVSAFIHIFTVVVCFCFILSKDFPVGEVFATPYLVKQRSQNIS